MLKLKIKLIIIKVAWLAHALLIRAYQLGKLRRARFLLFSFISYLFHSLNLLAAPRVVQKERSVVEAMGIEPMSAILQALGATCLFFDYTYVTPRRHSWSHKTAS